MLLYTNRQKQAQTSLVTIKGFVLKYYFETKVLLFGTVSPLMSSRSVWSLIYDSQMGVLETTRLEGQVP